jgi:antitoxin component HigA of HigAB toxin-antitoxin module
MAVTQPRVVEPRAIRSEHEYRVALARIDQLIPLEDLESAGELDAWACYVEAYEERRARE